MRHDQINAVQQRALASCDPGSAKLGSSKGFCPKPIRVQVFNE
jgi:hypothetical protein